MSSKQFPLPCTKSCSNVCFFSRFLVHQIVLQCALFFSRFAVHQMVLQCVLFSAVCRAPIVRQRVPFSTACRAPERAPMRAFFRGLPCTKSCSNACFFAVCHAPNRAPMRAFFPGLSCAKSCSNACFFFRFIVRQIVLYGPNYDNYVESPCSCYSFFSCSENETKAR